jgi:crossover junction endodeoxyribonuclease RuvC
LYIFVVLQNNATNITPLAKQGCILGVDPGTLVLGYSVITYTATKIVVKEMSILKLSGEPDIYKRLGTIHQQLSKLIKIYKPTVMAIEAPFFGKNVQSMLKLGRAQGVCIAAAIQQGLDVVEYSPKKIKQAITGNGNADKEQVFKMLQQTCELPTHSPKYYDASDALSVAICHYYQSRQLLTGGTAKMKDWSAFIANNPDKVVKKK